MTRKNVKLAFIENDTTRKVAYKNRKKGLVKKVDELTTLCGVDACAIIYGPYHLQPEIWPSPSGVEEVLSKFMTLPEFEQRKKMVDQESFMRERISKAEKNLKKQWRDNREQKITMLMFQCLYVGNIEQNNVSMDDLDDLDWMIDQNLEKIARRIESGDSKTIIHQNQTAQSQLQIQTATPLLLPPPPPPPTAPNDDEFAMMSHGDVEMAMNNDDIMFMEMMMMNGGGHDETIRFGYDANLENGF